jgi:hypothetical protein
MWHLLGLFLVLLEQPVAEIELGILAGQLGLRPAHFGHPHTCTCSRERALGRRRAADLRKRRECGGRALA